MGRFDNLEVIDDAGRHHVPDPDLIQVAEQILELFIEMRPTYTPGRVSVSKKALPKFYLAARLCIARGMTPGQFVKTQLEGMARTGCFWPTAIANPDYIESIETHNMSRVRLARHYKSQLRTFEKWASIYGYRETLQDDTVQLTPLFKAVMANLLGYNDIVDEHRDAARLELEGVPIAHETFAGYIGFLDA